MDQNDNNRSNSTDTTVIINIRRLILTQYEVRRSYAGRYRRD